MKVVAVYFFYGSSCYPVSENNLKLFPEIKDTSDTEGFMKVLHMLAGGNKKLKIEEHSKNMDGETVFMGDGFHVVYA